MTARYPFASGDPLQQRYVYSYAPFGGMALLQAWRASREATILALTTTEAVTPCDSPPESLEPRNDWLSTDTLIDQLKASLADPAPDWKRLDRLVARYEASKRLHAFQDGEGKGIRESSFTSLPSYLAFGELLVAAWRVRQHWPYLNALLKICDLLASYADRIPTSLRLRAAAVLQDEVSLLADLTKKTLP